jgi:hypothetical protein
MNGLISGTFRVKPAKVDIYLSDLNFWNRHPIMIQGLPERINLLSHI